MKSLSPALRTLRTATQPNGQFLLQRHFSSAEEVDTNQSLVYFINTLMSTSGSSSSSWTASWKRKTQELCSVLSLCFLLSPSSLSI